MTKSTTSEATDEHTDIATTATDLQDSFDEMSELMDDLSETMSEVADGFAAFGSDDRGRNGPRADRTTGGFAAADD